MSFHARFLFEPRDLWIGLYVRHWGWTWEGGVRVFTFYLAVVPCLPLRVDIYRKVWSRL